METFWEKGTSLWKYFRKVIGLVRNEVGHNGKNYLKFVINRIRNVNCVKLNLFMVYVHFVSRY